MNAVEIISKSQISQINLNDDDKSLDGSKTFGDIKATIAQAIEKINAALPKMKAAGVDMTKAGYDAENLFRNIVRKGWGGNNVDFYTIRNGNKAIVNVTDRNIDDIAKQISNFVINY